jgi:hypothetical protein
MRFMEINRPTEYATDPNGIAAPSAIWDCVTATSVSRFSMPSRNDNNFALLPRNTAGFPLAAAPVAFALRPRRFEPGSLFPDAGIAPVAAA